MYKQLRLVLHIIKKQLKKQKKCRMRYKFYFHLFKWLIFDTKQPNIQKHNIIMDFSSHKEVKHRTRKN